MQVLLVKTSMRSTRHDGSGEASCSVAVSELLLTVKPSLTLLPSTKSMPLLIGMRHTACGWREDLAAWVVLHVLAALHVIDVARVKLVAEALNQLIVNCSSHLLHAVLLVAKDSCGLRLACAAKRFEVFVFWTGASLLHQ